MNRNSTSSSKRPNEHSEQLGRTDRLAACLQCFPTCASLAEGWNTLTEAQRKCGGKKEANSCCQTATLHESVTQNNISRKRC